MPQYPLSPSSLRTSAPASLLVGAALLALLAACGPAGPEPQPEAPSAEEPTPRQVAALLALWNRGVSELDRYEYELGAATFQEVTRLAPEHPDAWFNFGIATMNRAKAELYPKARQAFERALELEPGHLRATYCLGRLLVFLGESATARPLLERVHARDPDDPDVNFVLGQLAMKEQRWPDAERYLRVALDSTPHFTSAMNSLQQVLGRQRKNDERRALLTRYREFQKTKAGRLHGTVYNEMGEHGRAIRAFRLAPAPARPDAQVPALAFAVQPGSPEGRGSRPARLAPPPGVDHRTFLLEHFLPRFGTGAAMGDVDGDGDLDLFLATGRDAGRLLLDVSTGAEPARFEDASSAWGLRDAEGRSVSACFGDLDHDRDLDLFVACAGPDLLFINEGGRFVERGEAAGVRGGDVFSTHAVMADLDADADLDLAVGVLCAMPPAGEPARPWPEGFVGAPNRAWANRRDGTFEDRAPAMGWTAPSRTTAVLLADLDGDRDVDVHELNHGQPNRLLRNDRLWAFVDRSQTSGLADAGAAAGALCEDLDGDGRFEVILLRGSGEKAAVFERRKGFLHFVPHAEWDPACARLAADSAVALDLERDGDLDLLFAAGDEVEVVLSDGERPSARRQLEGLEGGSLRTLMAFDANGDAALDLVGSVAGAAAAVPFLAVAEHRAEGGAFELRLMGTQEEGETRANTGGIGTAVEIVCGTHRQHRQLLGGGGVLGGGQGQLSFGTGKDLEIDYVRLVWPDDVIQSEEVVPVDGAVRTITQEQRKASSCPILFAWDGERYRFVADFLGVGGLGYFLAPGSYAAPDPTENLKIPHLAPRDGGYEMRVPEPMEEVLYLDHLALLAYDHPADEEIWPDERLGTSEPFPTGRPVRIRTQDRVFPIRLSTAEGPADPKLLHGVDRRFQPGVHRDRRFQGFSAPQEIVLDFGRPLAELGERPVLFVHGWVEYPYSHINYAASQAGLSARTISIDAGTGDGSFRPLWKDAGYPAGMPKMATFPLDTSTLGDARVLRLRTNLTIFLDQVFVAPALPMDGIAAHRLTPESARLLRAGYPRKYSPDGRKPLLYDHALQEPEIPFKTLRGFYTRFGDVTPLLQARDDRFVIYAHPEEIAVRFPLAPPLPAGLQRTFVLESSGYCKDMDLYTAAPDTVYPLPFRSMSSYPPPVGEEPADGEAWKAYQDRWNTRWLEGSRPR